MGSTYHGVGTVVKPTQGLQPFCGLPGAAHEMGRSVSHTPGSLRRSDSEDKKGRKLFGIVSEELIKPDLHRRNVPLFVQHVRTKLILKALFQNIRVENALTSQKRHIRSILGKISTHLGEDQIVSLQSFQGQVAELGRSYIDKPAWIFRRAMSYAYHLKV